MLALHPGSLEYAGVCQLQSAGAQHAKGSPEWAKSIAEVNVHGAGGTVVDPKLGRRGVLGLLSSMMAHECAPSAVVHISSEADGSIVSLYTIRQVAAGELISISYVASYQPTEIRRGLLSNQHGFTCMCMRCTTLPEHVRAFQCPNCHDGPCSPTSPSAECRELVCDACAMTMGLDEEAWGHYARAETSNDVSVCMELLHPFHHRMVKLYQAQLLKMGGAQRAQVLQQHAEARARLYASFSDSSIAHSLVANDIEAAAVACLDAGEVEEAASLFCEAGNRFAAFYGPVDGPVIGGTADAARCLRAARVQSVTEYQALGVEVLAHH